MLTRERLIGLSKPGRYAGGELNAVSKPITAETTRFAFCFPDIYEVGMSHLGLQLIYFFLNRRADTFCERAFMPWFDMVQMLSDESTEEKLFALESGDALADFDFLGFTLQYEMSYTNVLAMLDLAGLPLKASERGENTPIVCAGGPCAVNPEPMSDFIDFFYIGDAEASFDTLLDRFFIHKKSGGSKADFLRGITDIPGIYVPAFYEVSYGGDGKLETFSPVGTAPAVVKRAILDKLDFFPDEMIVPLIEAVHDRAVLEIARGCMRGCRFCQAGFIYRPKRERGVTELLSHAEKILSSTGHEEISLLSLSACDYSAFEELVDKLIEFTTKKHINISLPSTRLDALSALAKIQAVRKSSLTVAPEAGSQRMRDIINKNLSEEEILEGCYQAFLSGFDKIKLYFMAGLPFEEDADVFAIADLCDKVVDAYYRLSYEARKRPVSVSVSTACFVPKPFTPFQWAAQEKPENFIYNQQNLKSRIKNKRVVYRYHDAKTAHIEAALARGDRRVGAAIENAYRLGALFDGWSEHFRYDTWTAAFEKAGLDVAFFANRERNTDELLPWDFIDIGVSKDFLRKEWENAVNEVKTPSCREICSGCGLECGKGGGLHD